MRATVSVPRQASEGSCGVGDISGSPFTFNVPVSGYVYEVIAVDANPDYCPDAQPDPNRAFNCVRMDSTPFVGDTTGGLVDIVADGETALCFEARKTTKLPPPAMEHS